MNYWLNALTFEERLDVFSPFVRNASEDIFTKEAIDEMESWKQALTVDDESYLKFRLTEEKLSEEEFLKVLSLRPEQLFERVNAPRWLREILESEVEYISSDQMPQIVTEHPFGLILTPFYPLIRMYVYRLRSDLDKISEFQKISLVDANDLANSMLSPFVGRLGFMAQRTMALEVNVARVLGGLGADTSEERFVEFCKRFEDAEFRVHFLKEYCSLTRAIQQELFNWHQANLEIVLRLSQDVSLLALNFGDLGKLTQISSQAGDLHCMGRSVRILSFSNDIKIVYKPHSMSVDHSFQKLIEWLNAHGQLHPLHKIRILDRGGYGWAEFISPKPCDSIADIDVFYFRLGSLLALFYTLGATDIHFENIIASGSHPIIVDLETLFHAHVHFSESKSANDLINLEIANSVMSIGILPSPVKVEEETFDSSALAGRSSQLQPSKFVLMDARGTDEMKVVRGALRSKKVLNRPYFKGQTVEPKVSYQSFLNGFEKTFDILINRKDDLLSTDGPLSEFNNNKVRLVLRPTRYYESLWGESWHPDLLRDGLSRSKHFDLLWTSSSRALLPYINSEKVQLLAGDIPYFSVKPSGQDLTGGCALQFHSMPEKNGWKIVKNRITRLSQEEKQRQLWFINASLGFVEPATSGRVPSATRSLAGRNEEKPIGLAIAVGNEVLNSAFRFRESASWLSATPLGDLHEGVDSHCKISPIGPGLYDGIAGIIMFLAYLGESTGDRQFLDLAKCALTTFEDDKGRRQFASSLGVFSGVGTEIYLYAHMGSIFREPRLFDLGRNSLARLEMLIDSDDKFDIISGSAGCILALLAFAKVQPDSRAVEMAIKCGNHLINKSTKMAKGIGWRELKFQRGFSHGSSGIAYALSELSKATSNDSFRISALEALTWERSLIHSSGWTDKSFQTNGVQQSSWCHGAPGIAMSRMQIYRHLQTNELREDCVLALSAVEDAKQIDSQCLCHGEMGNLDALILAAELFPEETRWRELKDTKEKQIMDEVRKKGFRSAFSYQSESRGLMCGISGLGYGALRLARSNAIPSVLLLEAPTKLNR